jgi:hypothetical protein
MTFPTSHACALLATGWLGFGPAAAQHDPTSATGIAPQAKFHLAQAGPFVSTRQGTQRRPEFMGLFPGMPASELPTSLTRTGNIGEFAGFIGPDYIEARVWGGTLIELSIVYYAQPLGPRPMIDRSLSLQEAWRLHSPSEDVPEFGLYMTHLYKVDGLIDARNLIVYRLRFPQHSFSRTSPPLFDPGTRVERVMYIKDRPDISSNYQPIPSVALLNLIAERYREAFLR